MSKMFRSVSETWNQFFDCEWDCYYYSTKDLANTKLKHQDRYRNGFEPGFEEKDLKRRFKLGSLVAVSLMGDIAFCKQEWLDRILARIREFPETNFLLQTKNPAIFVSMDIPANVYAGTTIETNRNNKHSKAPQAHARYIVMANLKHPRKFISIEPVMDFDLIPMSKWLKDIMPSIVEIGADNYNKGLPAPPWWKVDHLIIELEELGITVNRKSGLDKLRGYYHDDPDK